MHCKMLIVSGTLEPAGACLHRNSDPGLTDTFKVPVNNIKRIKAGCLAFMRFNCLLFYLPVINTALLPSVGT